MKIYINILFVLVLFSERSFAAGLRCSLMFSKPSNYFSQNESSLKYNLGRSFFLLFWGNPKLLSLKDVQSKIEELKRAPLNYFTEKTLLYLEMQYYFIQKQYDKVFDLFVIYFLKYQYVTIGDTNSFIQNSKKSDVEKMLVSWFTGTGYKDINKYLSGLEVPHWKKEHLEYIIQLVQFVFLNYPKVEGPVQRFSNYGLDWQNPFAIPEKGQSINSAIFLSTSLYGKNPYQNDNLRFEFVIESKTGRKIGKNSIVINRVKEHEVLFLPGTEFYVVKVKKQKNSKVTIYLTEKD